jgi:hypothetical protein
MIQCRLGRFRTACFKVLLGFTDSGSHVANENPVRRGK